MSEEYSSLRILRLRANNFKNLKVVDIEQPEGERLVHITGKNGAGKTSVLDAIESVFMGNRALPDQPIRNGQTRADVTVDTDELTLTRTFTTNGSRLTVRNKHGMPLKTPQAILDRLFGNLSFDPLEFVRLKPKEQVNRLLEICPLDVDIEALDEQRQQAFEDRTLVRREYERNKGALSNYIDVPEEEPESIDVGAIVRERSERQKLWEEKSRKEREAKAAEDALSSLRGRYKDLQDRERSLEDQLQQLRQTMAGVMEDGKKMVAEVAALNNEVAAIPEVTFDDLDAKLEQAEEVNALARRYDEKQTVLGEVSDREKEVQALTKEIEDIDRQKKEALQRASLPIQGLGFGSPDGITFNGVPLQQSSTGEQIKVGVALAIASNPNLRFIRINDGSLLDSTNRAIIEEMLEDHDYYAWMEEVDESGEAGIVIEEGMVKEE